MSDSVVSSLTTIPCPRCGQTLQIATEKTDVTCACGFTAFAPYVTEAHYLRTGLPAWQARLAELDDAISRGLYPESVADVQKQTEYKPAATADQYLVGGGSILLFAGLAAFVGIMWRFLPSIGQGALLALITVVLAVLAIRLAKRIQSTATALSGLAVGSWAIDMGWTINHFGTNTRMVETLVLPAALSTLTAIVFNVLGRRYSNATWKIVGQIFIPTSMGMTLTSITLNISRSGDVTSAQLAALALPMTIAAVLLVGNSATIQRVFIGVERNVAIVVLLLFTLGFATASFMSTVDSAALAWALHLVVLTFVAWRTRGSEFIAPFTAVLVVPLLVDYFGNRTQISAADYSLAALPLTLLLLAVVDYPAQLQLLVIEKSRLFLSVITSLLVLNYIQASFTIGNTAYYSWAIHSVVLALVASRRVKIRGLSPVLFAISISLSAGFLDLPISLRVVLPALTCLLSLRLNTTSKIPTALLVSAISIFWILLSFAEVSAEEVTQYAALLSALTGIAVMAHTWKTKEIRFAILSSAFLCASVNFINVHLGITTLESFTLPIAAVLLASGLLVYRIDATLSSLVWLAPSFAMAIIPSALRSAEMMDYSTRFTITLIATLALLIVGARMRYVGMLAVGLVSVFIFARNPAVYLLGVVQPSISFTLSGLLLLLAGARFEILRKRAGVAKDWVSGTLR